MSLYELRPSLTLREVDWILGMTLGGMSYGALLALSLNCLVHLHDATKAPGCNGFWTQTRALQGHVTLVLVFNTILQVKNIQEFLGAVFFLNPDQLTAVYMNQFGIFIVMIAMLTDGLLVSNR